MIIFKKRMTTPISSNAVQNKKEKIYRIVIGGQIDNVMYKADAQ